MTTETRRPTRRISTPNESTSGGVTLRHLVHSVLEQTDLASPEEVAAAVARGVPAKRVRAVLVEALTAYVRTTMQQRRAHNPILADEQRTQSARSSKVAAIRDSWASALRDRVHVSDGWKLLGECTFEDLMFAAAERREHAARNLAKADQFEALASRLESAGVETVADLPESALDVLESAA